MRVLFITVLVGGAFAGAALAQDISAPLPYVGADQSWHSRAREDKAPGASNLTGTIGETEVQNSLPSSNENNSPEEGFAGQRSNRSKRLSFRNGQGWVPLTETQGPESALKSRNAKNRTTTQSDDARGRQNFASTDAVALPSSTATSGSAPRPSGNADPNRPAVKLNAHSPNRNEQAETHASLSATSPRMTEIFQIPSSRVVDENRSDDSLAQGRPAVPAERQRLFTPFFNGQTSIKDIVQVPTSIFSFSNRVWMREDLQLPDDSFAFEPGKNIVLSKDQLSTLFTLRSERQNGPARQSDCLRARESHIGYATWVKTCGVRPADGRQKKKPENRTLFGDSNQLHGTSPFR